VWFVAIAGVVSGFLSNAASAVVKRMWSLKSTTKTGDCRNLSAVLFLLRFRFEFFFP
jgi:hypothetical protein